MVVNWLLFFAPFTLFLLPLLQGKVLYWGTAMLQFIPWRAYGFALMEQGNFPFWNPLNGMGAPLFANYQSAFLYPISFILYPFYHFGGVPALAWGYTLLVPVHLGIAGIGTAMLLKQMGVPARGQLVAGLAFSFSSYFVARASFFSMIWAGVWLPWLVWAVERLIRSNSRFEGMKGAAALALIAANQFLAGHAQLTWYSLVFVGFWILLRLALLRNRRAIFRSILYLSGGFLFAVLMAAVQLLPTFEYLQQSQRSNAVDFEFALNYSLWPWRLSGFLLPDLFGNPGLGNYWGYGAYWEDALYIGFVPFVLAFISLRRVFLSKGEGEGNSHRSLIIFLWVIIGLSIALSLGKNTPVFPWLYRNVPTFDMFQAPTRWMFLVVFSLSLLAGVEISYWRSPSEVMRRNLRLISVGGLSIFAGTLAAKYFLPQIEPTFIRSFLILGVLISVGALIGLKTPNELNSAHEKFSIWKVLSVVFILLDLWFANAFTNPYVHAAFFNKKQAPNVILNPKSRIYIPVSIEDRLKFGKFLFFNDFYLNKNLTEMYSLPLPDLNLLFGEAMVNNFDPLVPARYDRWMRWLDEIAPELAEFQLRNMGVSGVILLENERENDWKLHPLDAGARIGWRGCQKVLAAEKEPYPSEILQEMSNSTEGECIIVEAESQCNMLSLNEKDNAILEVHRDEVDLLEIDVDTPSTGWLRVADTWYPGWKAMIDGQRVKVQRVDYLFKGVCVPAGQHSVIIYYQPTGFPYLSWLSVGAFLVSLLSYLLTNFQQKRACKRSHG